MSCALGTGTATERESRWIMLLVLVVILIANGAYSGLVNIDIRPVLMPYSGGR